ncbi:MAG: NADH-quinone oxidoreductase subunit J [Paludibacteraceae bacterium]|jgi:NADH-quinone oxidoreductase subunit J|nr:NADH-quinone oxidoreductase subunit J [Paludibacteraceae bacterium]
MEITASQIIFYILSAIIVGCSIMSVVSRKILRAATYLLFVLIATAGFYVLLNYHFLAAIQISVYVGGILVLFVFSIFLTSQVGEKMPQVKLSRRIAGLIVSLGGAALTLFVLLTQNYPYAAKVSESEIDMYAIGQSLMGTERFQYLLPFEAISVLLLACIITGILVARKK